MKKLHKHSSGDGHPYRKLSFWRNPSNHYWESENHTEKSKQHHRDWLKSMIKEEKRPYMNKKAS